MADQSDVANALESLIATTLYPNGVSGPTAVSPVAGALVDIRRGWPLPDVLQQAVGAGNVLITVYAQPSATRNATRFMPIWRELPSEPVSLTVETTATTATFAGTCADGQLAGIGFGNTPYSTAVTAQDTPATVAARLQALINGATVSGSTVTVPYPGMVARTAQAVNASLETRRQDQGFQICIWCQTPQTRDVVGKALDGAIAGLADSYGNLTQFIDLADGSKARLRYVRSTEFDVTQNDLFWRRDFVYMAEYATTISQQQTAMLFGLTNLNGTYTLDSTSSDVLMTDGDVALVGADGIEIRP